ncbi:hypothetical protein [Weissella muntiaci]|nr:hypothetical protein [Weissella muntiaci]
MENLHWDLNTVDEQDYAELIEVLSANKDDRMVSPEEMAKQWASLN